MIGPGADSADPDADGRPNLLEYALGTVPNVADSGSPTTVTVSGGVLALTFAHIGDPAIGYVVEASGDLITWTTAHTYTGFTASGSTTYTDGTALSAGSRRFLRLKITAP